MGESGDHPGVVATEPGAALAQARQVALHEWAPQVVRLRRGGKKGGAVPPDLASFLIERAFLRLVSLAFLSDTGKFVLDHRTDYPFALYDHWRMRPGPYRFEQKLRLLFASAIHQPSGAARRLLTSQLGAVPYLAGGLFRPGWLEDDQEVRAGALSVPDEFYESFLGPNGILRRLRFSLAGDQPDHVRLADLERIYASDGDTIDDPDAETVLITQAGSGSTLLDGLRKPGRRLMADRLSRWVAVCGTPSDAERARHMVALAVWAREGIKAPLPELADVIRVGSVPADSTSDEQEVVFRPVPTQDDWTELGRHVVAMANASGGAILLTSLLGESEILEGLSNTVDPISGQTFRLTNLAPDRWRIEVRPQEGCTYLMTKDKFGRTLEELYIREHRRTTILQDRRRDLFVLSRMDQMRPL